MASRAFASLTFGAAVVASAFVWIACGSSSSTPQFNGADGGSSGGGSSSSGGSSGGTSSGSSSGSAGSSSGTGSSGSSSGGSSGSSGSSSGGISDAGACPATPCSGGETCCAANISTTAPKCESSCPANDVVNCTVPSDCAGSTDGGTECCATVVLADNPDGAAFPYCNIGSLSSYCGKCTTDIGATCTSTEKLHVCAQASDCTSDNNTECCAVLGYNICVASVEAVAANLTCL